MNYVGRAVQGRLLLILLALPAGWTAAAETGYHLTGIMGSDSGMTFAVIESADGQQQLLKEGGAIGSGYVKKISPLEKTVILALPEGDFLLRLTGSGKPEEYREEYSLLAYNDNVAQKSLDAQSLSKLLALADTAGNFDDRQLSERLNELLGLSPQAKLAAYNDEEVESTRSLLQKLGSQISGLAEQSNFLGTIAVSDEGGRRRVYLSTEPSTESGQK